MSLLLERIFTPYEFEDRATFFIQEIESLADSFPLLLIEPENKTTEDLTHNSTAIKHFATKDNTKKTAILYKSGYQMEIESADENKVLVAVFGNKKRGIEKFRKNADGIAQHFNGYRVNHNDILDHGSGEFRYFTALIYSFK